MNWIFRLCLALATSLLLGESAFAQGSAGEPVVLAIVDDFPAADSRALIVRYPASAGARDMIILDRAFATSDGLASALILLRKLRSTQGAISRVQTAMIAGAVPEKPLSSGRRAYLETGLAKLAGQQPSRVGNLGRGQWIELPHDRLGPADRPASR